MSLSKISSKKQYVRLINTLKMFSGLLPSKNIPKINL